MSTIQAKQALVLGASSGIGRATVKLLVSHGVRVVAVARGSAALETLRSELGAAVETLQADAADPATAAHLLRAFRPELVVLAAGAHPHMAALDEQTWEDFSAAWHNDTQAAFHLARAALTTPLAPGSTVVIVSSGAAVNGSPLSGGYAGAKRMQWLLARYAQQRAEQRKLGIRFVALLPSQLVTGTQIGSAASEAYAALQGISGAEFMQRYDQPLGVDGVAQAIVAGLRGDIAQGVTAISVTGRGVEPLA